jgi:hypothetical protein
MGPSSLDGLEGAWWRPAFDGGDIVSDGGVLLLKRVDERLGLTRAAALALGDERRSASVHHSVHSLLAQRIYGLCLGWSDVCDHNVLRNDLVMQTAVGRAQPLASAPTLSRAAAAPGLAEGQDHRAGRLWLLPPSRAAAPGALGRELHHRAAEELAPCAAAPTLSSITSRHWKAHEHPTDQPRGPL